VTVRRREVTNRSRAPRREPRAARLLAVCALLCGLFLMHGAPASAADGCHASWPTAMTTAMTTRPMHSSPSATPSATATATPSATATASADAYGGHCVALQARERIALPWPDAGAVPVLARTAPAVVLAAGGAGGAQRWRGPPSGGRELLLRVSVART
jgi:hypothetical protein